MLFKAYELWFKQIIFEMDSIIDMLAKPVNRQAVIFHVYLLIAY